MEPIHVSILIVGAGPTGLGAATRLEQLQHESYLLVEASHEAGGLASSVCTEEGFWFDLGGHVIFSHYKYFDDVLQCCVGSFDDVRHWAKHKRESYVYLDDTWVPYPFQLNFGVLRNIDIKMDCLKGLIEVDMERRLNQEHGRLTGSVLSIDDVDRTKEERIDESTACGRMRTFDDWILAGMGPGIHHHFMKPYNFKVWAYPTTEMSYSWLGERVATVDLDAALRSCLTHTHDQDDDDDGDANDCRQWGPNAFFVFPQQGGTGSIWKSVAQKAIPNEKKSFGKRLTHLDQLKKIATFQDGSRIQFNSLISTTPLDSTLQLVGQTALAKELRYSSTHVVGLGVRGPNPHNTKCWLYFPQDWCNFYRCTVFSHYAKANCPADDVRLPTMFRAGDVKEWESEHITSMEEARAGPYHSLMFEISSSVAHKPVNEHSVIQDTVVGAVRVGLLSDESDIVSVFHRREERGYPTPFVGRDEVLAQAFTCLEAGNIYSRGRFGCWKYEVSNQDHSFMLGVEVADRLLFGSEEVTCNMPHVINGTKGVKQVDRVYVKDS